MDTPISLWAPAGTASEYLHVPGIELKPSDYEYWPVLNKLKGNPLQLSKSTYIHMELDLISTLLTQLPTKWKKLHLRIKIG